MTTATKASGTRIDVEKVRELAASGMKDGEIALRLSCCRSLVSRIRRENDIAGAHICGRPARALLAKRIAPMLRAGMLLPHIAAELGIAYSHARKIRQEFSLPHSTRAIAAQLAAGIRSRHPAMIAKRETERHDQRRAIAAAFGLRMSLNENELKAVVALAVRSPQTVDELRSTIGLVPLSAIQACNTRCLDNLLRMGLVLAIRRHAGGRRGRRSNLYMLTAKACELISNAPNTGGQRDEEAKPETEAHTQEATQGGRRTRCAARDRNRDAG